jgi:protein ImuB
VLAEIPEGPPARFTWRRLTCRIVKAEGPERIAPQWWRLADAAAAKPPRPRDYYTVEDAHGARYWLFRDGLYGESGADTAPAWYLHGLGP